MLSDDLLNGASAAAQFLGIDRQIVYRMVREGNLPVIRKGGRRMYFRKSELEQAFTGKAA